MTLSICVFIVFLAVLSHVGTSYNLLVCTNAPHCILKLANTLDLLLLLLALATAFPFWLTRWVPSIQGMSIAFATAYHISILEISLIPRKLVLLQLLLVLFFLPLLYFLSRWAITPYPILPRSWTRLLTSTPLLLLRSQLLLLLL
jgi:hypothetical protein